MPKRTRQHILETNSRIEFSRILPKDWVFRDVNPDYGIDGIVEVFDETGNASGGCFLVQLKATDEKLITKALRIVLKTDTGEYYKNIVLPVLVVLFHSDSKRIYARFFDKHIKIPENQKTFTFELSGNDYWGDKLVETVHNKLSFLKSVTDSAFRNKLIEEYYKYQLLSNFDAHSNQNNEVKLKKGCRVKHDVFGEGVVESVTEYYLFAKFDKDSMSRKFLPCSFSEFIATKK